MAPQGCHIVNSVPPAGLRGRAPAPPESSPCLQSGSGGDVSKRLGSRYRLGRSRTCLATSRTFAASPINGHHLKLRVIGGWASRPARSAIRVIGIAPRTAALTTPTPSRTVVSSPHPLAPTAAWPGRASEGRATCCSRGGFRPRWHSAKPLAHLSVWFSGWNEGSVGCSEVRLSCLPCSAWR